MGVISVDKLILILETKFKGAKEFKKLDKTLGDISDVVDKNMKGFSKFGKILSGISGKLLGVGFGLLFIGMAIKAFSTKIITSLVTAFTTARDEGDFLSNKILGLSAAFEFLKFSIFDAFANSDLFIPIVDAIINITNAVSLFIAKHPGLATFLVLFAAFGVVLGGVMMFLGQIVLGVLASIAAFQLLLPIFGAILSIGLMPILIIIGIIIAVIVLLAAMWATNFNNIRDVVKETFGIIWETIKVVAGNIGGIFSGLFDVIKGLFTGDWDLIWIGVVKVVYNAAAGILNLIIGLGTGIFNVFNFIISAIGDLFFSLIQIAIGAVKSLIRMINKIPGINISTGGLDSIISGLDNLKLKNDFSISKDFVANLQAEVEAFKNSKIDSLTQRDERAAANNTTINVTVEGNVIGEEDMVTRVLRNINITDIGSTNGG